MRLQNIRSHQCSALYEAYVRVLLKLDERFTQVVRQPLQVLHQLYLGIFECLESVFKITIVQLHALFPLSTLAFCKVPIVTSG